MNTPIEIVALLQGLLSWLQIILELAGLVICIRYLRLSTAMFLLALAFAGFAASAVASQVFMYVIRIEPSLAQSSGVLFLIVHLISIGSTAALVVGLFAVLRDVRERFHFLREAHEQHGKQATGTRDQESGRHFPPPLTPDA